MDSTQLSSLYQQLILEHYRNPRHKAELEGKSVEIHMANPVCGDEIRLQLRIEGDEIAEAKVRGPGLLNFPGRHQHDDDQAAGREALRRECSGPAVHGDDARGRDRREGQVARRFTGTPGRQQIPRAHKVCATRIRRPSRSPQGWRPGVDALTSVEVHSAHLPGTRAGPITIWTSPIGVRRIEFGALPRERHTDPPEAWPDNLRDAVAQLEAYFSKKRTVFDLDLDFWGSATEFQLEVYDRLLALEYGHVSSYGQIARDIGKPDQARAVGQAVGANPIPIVVPCHRIIASDGRLTGFSGGLAAKVSLLKLEGVEVDGSSPNSKVHPEVIPLDL